MTKWKRKPIPPKPVLYDAIENTLGITVFAFRGSREWPPGYWLVNGEVMDNATFRSLYEPAAKVMIT